MDTYTFLGGRVYNGIEDGSDRFEPHLYTMRHTYRQELKKTAYKCFYKTRNIYTANNHMPWKCLKPKGITRCVNHFVDPKMGYFLHFKKDILWPENCKSKDKRKCAVYDPILWKYSQNLNRNMKITFRNIF